MGASLNLSILILHSSYEAPFGGAWSFNNKSTEFYTLKSAYVVEHAIWRDNSEEKYLQLNILNLCVTVKFNRWRMLVQFQPTSNLVKSRILPNVLVNKTVDNPSK